MPKVIYEKDGRIGRITLNRPEVMNAIDDDVPVELADCVASANADPGVHVIVLAGAGEAFCAGYDLTYYAQGTGGTGVTQEMPWDPMKDYAFMMRNTELFMSLWRSYRPVICKVHGYAVAGGSDIALCADIIVMSTDATHRLYADARVGMPDHRHVGLPAGPGAGEAYAVYRRQDHRRRGRKARAGAQGRAARTARRGSRGAGARMATVPVNQLMMQKLVVNQAIEAMGLKTTQLIATVFDGITRHSPEGLNFKRRAETVGWKQAVRERDNGTWDWTENRPINPR